MPAERFVIARTDRLGDVLTSLPALDYVRDALPDAEITFVGKPILHELLRPFLEKRRIRWADSADLGVFSGASGALFLSHDPRLLQLAWRSRVPVRCGLYSKWRSFLFLNRGRRQQRSLAQIPEGRYSLELAEDFVEAVSGKRKTARFAPVLLDGDVPSRELAKQKLAAMGVNPDVPFGILHPGMGGSALNLSADCYADAAAAVESAYGISLLFCEGPSEEDVRLVKELSEKHAPAGVIRGVSLSVLREIFRLSKIVIAPSTGPLHLAHYVGVVTIGFFPPIKSQRAERWGPWGGVGSSRVLFPDVDCPATRECLGPRCRAFPCMEKVRWGQLILNKAGGLSGETGQRGA